MKKTLCLCALTLLTGCGSHDAMTSVAHKAQSIWQQIAGSRCHDDAVLAAIRDQSDYSIDHPVRGRSTPPEIRVAVEDARESTQRDDRIVCSAVVVATGPRVAMSRHLLTHEGHGSAEFRLQEQAAGWNDNVQNADAADGTIIGSLLANAGVALQISVTLLRVDDADDPTPVPFRSPIEFAVTPKGPTELIAWMWIDGSSPQWHAARSLRALSSTKLAPS